MQCTWSFPYCIIDNRHFRNPCNLRYLLLVATWSFLVQLRKNEHLQSATRRNHQRYDNNHHNCIHPSIRSGVQDNYPTDPKIITIIIIKDQSLFRQWQESCIGVACQRIHKSRWTVKPNRFFFSPRNELPQHHALQSGILAITTCQNCIIVNTHFANGQQISPSASMPA